MIIKDLGRWESLEIVQRYTRSVSSSNSLRSYKPPLQWKIVEREGFREALEYLSIFRYPNFIARHKFMSQRLFRKSSIARLTAPGFSAKTIWVPPSIITSLAPSMLSARYLVYFGGVIMSSLPHRARVGSLMS